MDKVNFDFSSKLATLGLNPSNSVVIGSGILDALAIRNSSDIDVVVDESTYNQLKTSGRFQEKRQYDRLVLVDDSFEINTNWGVLGKRQTLSDLISQSAVINDVRYITLDFLLAVKKSWLKDDNVRQKDIDDVRLIETYDENISRTTRTNQP